MKIFMGGLEDGCDFFVWNRFGIWVGICVLLKSFYVLCIVDTHRLVEFSERPKHLSLMELVISKEQRDQRVTLWDAIGASFQGVGGFTGFLNDHT